MNGPRLLSGLAGAWTVSRSPVVPSRLAPVFGRPLRWAASATTVLLGRPDLPCDDRLNPPWSGWSL